MSDRTVEQRRDSVRVAMTTGIVLRQSAEDLDALARLAAEAERAEAALRDARVEAVRVRAIIDSQGGRGGTYKRLWIASRLCDLVLAGEPGAGE